MASSYTQAVVAHVVDVTDVGRVTVTVPSPLSTAAGKAGNTQHS